MTEHEKPYAVVWFPEETKNGEKLFDIVPQSWLVESPNNIWKCYYPPNEQKGVENLVKEKVTPVSTWKLFPVVIIKKAGDYEQGLRRLERAYANNLDVESTEVDNTDVDDRQQDVDDYADEPDVQKINDPKTRDKEQTGTKKRNKSTSVVAVQTGRPIEPELVERMGQMQINLSKLIKGAKQSILYDFNKKIEELKSTVIINRAPGVGTTIKQLKETLGVELPFKEDNAFKDFNRSVKQDDEKDAALRAVMVELAKGESDDKGAVRKILGSIMAKAVQELYSAAGRAGANGKTKKSLSATHVYDCMKDVIVDLLPGHTTPAAILSATSRYLSGAGDREGEKKARDAKKAMEEP